MPKRPADDPVRPAKRRRSKWAQDEDSYDAQHSITLAFGRMDNQLLADHFARSTARFGPDLSPVELADLSVPAASIRDTTEWQETRSLDKLADFLAHFSGGVDTLRTVSRDKGAPHTLVIAAAAIRAADIIRAMRPVAKGSVVAKLFAKHLKLEDQTQFLKKTRTGIGVGTPRRLIQLFDNGALSLHNLERVVLDVSHINVKKRNMLELEDAIMPLAKLLSRPDVKARFAMEKPLELLFY